MMLEEILDITTCECVELFSAETHDSIDVFNDRSEIPDYYLECEVTDVFPVIKGNPNSPEGCYPCLGIEIEIDE